MVIFTIISTIKFPSNCCCTILTCHDMTCHYLGHKMSHNVIKYHTFILCTSLITMSCDMSKIMSLFFDWQEVSGAGGGVLLAGVQGTSPHTCHPAPWPATWRWGTPTTTSTDYPAAVSHLSISVTLFSYLSANHDLFQFLPLYRWRPWHYHYTNQHTDITIVDMM